MAIVPSVGSTDDANVVTVDASSGVRISVKKWQHFCCFVFVFLPSRKALSYHRAASVKARSNDGWKAAARGSAAPKCVIMIHSMG